ncbi:hypothetical protein SeMB42_g03040 [Synchytrium endobioticum]|uniref:Uncharacterized protein n=1 Tax=Synchytrium endobioticum TaxID=286115 RepID=A0A507D944_9FUNG|nr:hypothetical protein SeLEV6574_g02406 [Synchytrium endobioticum]TPX48321.1 hypothetical protein SeMB42_g03040 [Synchytrium endobioticum]
MGASASASRQAATKARQAAPVHHRIPDPVTLDSSKDLQVVRNWSQMHFDLHIADGPLSKKDNDFLEILKNRSAHEASTCTTATTATTMSVREVERMLSLYQSNPRKWTVDALVQEMNLDRKRAPPMVSAVLKYLNTPQPSLTHATFSSGVRRAVWK